MADTTSTDLARFYQRYDQRQRLLFVAALAASLVLSAVDFTHGALTTGGNSAPFVARWFPIVFFPLFIAAWSGAQEFIARWRDRRPPMSADDVPNGLRIANAGFVFSLTWTAAMLGSQAIATLAAFGYSLGDLVPRATTVAFGVALICLGNVWPRLPTSRVPERKAAKSMRINRVWGWVMVIMGLAMVLQAPFSPLLYPLVRALHSHG